MEIAKLSKAPQKPVAKRLWHIIRAVYYMLYKGISKHNKLIIDLDSRLLFCRHADPTKSFYVPREVEFSCRNTPIFFQRKKMKRYESAKEIARAFEMLDNEEVHEDSFCFHGPSLSPIVLKEEMMEGENVDEEAEDFIRRFYQQLRSQQEPLLGRA
ncbi:uncharacterized protein A4U43_C05F26240 [Asparagus officinalis]|uniref:Uncharacterized protein n=1 Tax=Asparagus officinalis TaxID=4686 RepID=A0A5P1EZ40_ASPOF|nr:uncharacterized protein LOC109840070 [Asparagus officinalis]ONK69741.1 uncharacterized protein A4U43_C05F26240 [Asparagus officinalis]